MEEKPQSGRRTRVKTSTNMDRLRAFNLAWDTPFNLSIDTHTQLPLLVKIR
jgi:hypothetical protein